MSVTRVRDLPDGTTVTYNTATKKLSTVAPPLPVTAQPALEGLFRTANFAAASNKMYLIDAFDGSFTITAPGSPVHGDQVALLTAFGGNSFTFNAAPNSVFNEAGGYSSSVTVSSVLGTFRNWTYNATDGVWYRTS